MNCSFTWVGLLGWSLNTKSHFKFAGLSAKQTARKDSVLNVTFHFQTHATFVRNIDLPPFIELFSEFPFLIPPLILSGLKYKDSKMARKAGCEFCYLVVPSSTRSPNNPIFKLTNTGNYQAYLYTQSAIILYTVNL